MNIYKKIALENGIEWAGNTKIYRNELISCQQHQHQHHVILYFIHFIFLPITYLTLIQDFNIWMNI